MPIDRTLYRIQLICLCAFLYVAVSPLRATETVSCKLVGRVTVEGTGEPVAGVAVQVLAEKASTWKYAFLPWSAATGSHGDYSLALAPGHASIGEITCPPGYWVASQRAAIVTTAENPISHFDFVVQRGTAWRVRLALPNGTAPPPKIRFVVSDVDDPDLFENHAEVDKHLAGALTFPTEGGKFEIECSDESLGIVPPTPVQLSFDDAFDPTHVERVTRDAKTGEELLTDAKGRQARIRGASVNLQNQSAEIVIAAKLESPATLGKVSGVVTNKAGMAVDGARVAVAVFGNDGAVMLMERLSATSDAEGEFSIDQIPTAWVESRKLRYSLIAMKDGFAALATKPVPFGPGEHAAEPIRLLPVHAVKLRVIDADGKPVEGAWVEPQGSMADRFLFAKTDHEGRCTLEGLGEGKKQITILFGYSGRIVVAPVNDSSDEIEVKLPHTAQAAAIRPKPRRTIAVKIGETAPEWNVETWLDGKSRTMADFRGKPLVLNFWGAWCTPCVQAIPMMKSLEEKYTKDSVVFIGIHSAGTELSEISTTMKRHEWNCVTALDAGGELTIGKTSSIYGIRGWPTILVIDASGKVAYNSGLETEIKKLKARTPTIAKSLGLAWPPDKTWPDEKKAAWLAQIQQAVVSERIDAVLSKK